MSVTERLAKMPAWLRWMLFAAIGVFVLAAVQHFGTDDTTRLTEVRTSQTMLRWSVPILLAGLGGLFSERAGIVNIGLEGMMILGTWFGAWGTIEFGAWAGLLIGILGGALGGLIHAVATVRFGVDHIISGVAINILAPGIARFLSSEIFAGMQGGSVTQSPRTTAVGRFTMPFLAGGNIFGWESPDILGSIGDSNLFFIADFARLARGLMLETSLATIIALALVPLSTWVIWRTRFGLRLRSSGELPRQGEVQGVNVYFYRYAGVTFSGALAGLGGAFIASNELGGLYLEGQTNGRGFIGLAALIFGNYRPGGILLGALLFGYPFGLSLRDLDGAASHALLLVNTVALAAVGAWAATQRRLVDTTLAISLAIASAVWYFMSDTVPDWWTRILPFVIVLLVLVFFAQRLRAPAFNGQIYRRGE